MKQTRRMCILSSMDQCSLLCFMLFSVQVLEKQWRKKLVSLPLVQGCLEISPISLLLINFQSSNSYEIHSWNILYFLLMEESGWIMLTPSYLKLEHKTFWHFYKSNVNVVFWFDSLFLNTWTVQFHRANKWLYQ